MPCYITKVVSEQKGTFELKLIASASSPNTDDYNINISIRRDDAVKRWFESNRQYGSVCSRVQLENRGNTHFKWRLQDVKPFIQFWTIKTDVL